MCYSIYCKSVVDGAAVVHLLCQKSVYRLEDERGENKIECVAVVSLLKLVGLILK